MNFVYAKHFCGGKEVKSSLTLGGERLDCGMSMSKPKCLATQEQTQFSKKGCCENEYSLLSLEDDFSDSKSLETPVHLNALFSFVLVHFNIITEWNAHNDTFTYYSPPSLNPNRAILYQVFRI